MSKDLLSWNIYELNSRQSKLRGVGTRGRIRKYCLINSINIVVENAEDADNAVRFAVLSGSDAEPVIQYIRSFIPDAEIKLVKTGMKNPVLSKLVVNEENRYDLEKGKMD